MEANEEKRKYHQEIIKDIPKENLVYIDESGIDMSICKDRGWGKKNEKLAGKKSGKYYQRTNILAGYINHKPIAPMTFIQSCDTKLFEKWIEEFLIKELKFGQFVVMDNAAFHKSLRAKELIESAGCKIIFLPPYSPDLNPIEKFWAHMKRWIKSNISNFSQFKDAIDHFFRMSNSA